MSIKFAVLGLVAERPGYGYELIQRLNARIGPAWQLNPSTVYAALDQLEAGQLVAAQLRERKGAPPDLTARSGARVVYAPTELGLAEFRNWLARPAGRPQPVRAQIHLKIAVAGPEDLDLVLDAIDHERQLATQLRRECEAASVDGPVATVLQEAALVRLDGDLAWIDTARRALRDAGKDPRT